MLAVGQVLEATIHSATGITSFRPSFPEIVRVHVFLSYEMLMRDFQDVVIEFGHNDGGDPTTDTKGRADVYGESLTDSETVTIVNGSAEVVYTYTQ